MKIGFVTNIVYMYTEEETSKEKIILQKNRLIAKSEIDKLSLEKRIQMEADITDVRAVELDVTKFDNVSFDDYWGSIDWRRRAIGYLGNLEGKKVLDVACGYSMTPVFFAMAGAEVVGLDVAPKTLDQVRVVAKRKGVDDRINLHCGPAEQLPYDDDYFDIIYGGAAIHHLQISEAGRELSRVLKKGGRGVFQDPQGNNKLIEMIRDNLSYEEKHEEKGTDKPLTTTDIQNFGKNFQTFSWEGFGGTTSAIRMFRKLRVLRNAFEKIDKATFTLIPYLQRHAQYCLIFVKN